MHVAILCPYSFGYPGGVQEQAKGLARALVASGHEVTLLAPDMGKGAEGLDGVLTVSLGRAVRVPANGSVAPVGIDPRMLVRLELALDPADVVHVHEPFQPASLMAISRTPSQTPVVGTFHAASDRFLPYTLARPLLPLASRRLRVTTATSEASRSLVRRYLPIDPVIVPNGVDTSIFSGAKPDEWASSLGRYVLFLGRFEPRKGFEVALRAFAAMAHHDPDLHFVSTTPAATAAMVRDSLFERIHCIGLQPRDRVPGLYAGAQVYLAPNTGGESFGVVLVEAMAAGCPVLASDLPGFRAAGGDAVRYVAPGDLPAWRAALESLTADESARAELAALGRARAAAFDWPVVAERMVGVYRSVL